MITLTGLPSPLPPKSSTAICAAVTEPWPVGVDAGPFMSVSTPILTTSSEIWARAAGDADSAASKAANIDIVLANILSPPVIMGRIGPFCLTGSLARPVRPFAIIRWPASTQPIGQGRPDPPDQPPS